MTLVDVGSTADFRPGEIRVVSADGKEIGIVSWRESWFAVRNVCPHLGAPLCEGGVRPLLSQDCGPRGDPDVDFDRPIIECPWHHWEFDLSRGSSVIGVEQVKTYRVETRDGRVLVEIGGRPAS